MGDSMGIVTRLFSTKADAKDLNELLITILKIIIREEDTM